VASAALALATGALAACGSSSGSSSTSGSSGSSGKSGKVALLLPESKTARCESFDKPLFEKKLKELCSGCSVVYLNADQDAAKQQQQAQSALTQGVKVMVLDPVDGKAAESIANSAKAQKVPVIAYDRLISNADYYVTFDNATVGKQQAQSLVDKLKSDGNPTGPIIMINGSPTDNNAALFKQGAMSVFGPAGVKVLASYDTPDWSPDQAQQWAAGQVTQFGNQIKGVYAANDGTAGGAIAAMKAANVNPLPPVTGQDAELAGVQRVVAGDQYMTVYKPIVQEANDAAQAAYDFLQGKKPTAKSPATDGLATTLIPTQAVTADKVKDTVVKDGFWTTQQICTADYAAACQKLGLS
jgi:D-xylose transport system substrate-binding protein